MQYSGWYGTALAVAICGQYGRQHFGLSLSFFTIWMRGANEYLYSGASLAFQETTARIRAIKGAFLVMVHPLLNS